MRIFPTHGWMNRWCKSSYSFKPDPTTLQYPYPAMLNEVIEQQLLDLLLCKILKGDNKPYFQVSFPAEKGDKQRECES